MHLFADFQACFIMFIVDDIHFSLHIHRDNVQFFHHIHRGNVQFFHHIHRDDVQLCMRACQLFFPLGGKHCKVKPVTGGVNRDIHLHPRPLILVNIYILVTSLPSRKINHRSNKVRLRPCHDHKSYHYYEKIMRKPRLNIIKCVVKESVKLSGHSSIIMSAGKMNSVENRWNYIFSQFLQTKKCHPVTHWPRVERCSRAKTKGFLMEKDEATRPTLI